MRLLTEVLVVSDGSIDIRFRNSIDADTGVSIADFLQMELVSMSRDGNVMTLEYRADTVVGYKDPFTYYDPDAIPSIADELRKEPTKEFYRDLDGDGVGGGDVRFDFARPAGYSAVSGDCLDLDDTVFQGKRIGLTHLIWTDDMISIATVRKRWRLRRWVNAAASVRFGE